jgi:glucoamylase
MAKPYFNDAVAGNSRMLCCFTGRGELVRLFWPNIDYPQHIEKLSAGIFFTDRKNSTLWLEDDNWNHSQRYVPDTNIVETVYEDHEKGLIVIQHDFVLVDSDVLVRRYSVRNVGDHENSLGFVVYSSAISTNPDLRGTLFDFGCDAMVHYRHGYYLALTADREVFQYQLGDNAFESARYTELRGKDSIGMMQDGALLWNLGRFAGGGTQTFALFICASDTLKGVKQLVREIKGEDAFSLFEGVRNYWEGFLGDVRYMDFFNESGTLRNTAVSRKEIEDLYKRSVLVFKLMADEKTGGLLAAPEVDEGFTRCGRYAYCWGRDAAFITDALDRCGLSPAVDKFYEWAVETQDDSGAWHQRYHMDGNLAPSWGLQIDETGTLIWGMLKHYRVVNDSGFLQKMWESVRKGTEFLTGFIDDETGLPRPSYDLWEERLGEHAYSAAAVHGGITASIEIAGILGINGEMVEKWQAAADRIKDAIECRLF